MDGKQRLENLLQDVDKLIATDQSLRGYILLIIDDDYQAELIAQGESQEVLLDGLEQISQIDFKGDFDDE